jgi:hypothetical protein
VHEEGCEEVTTTKIAEFKGTLPRISPELLPGTAAQIALDAKLYSGDLIPTPVPVVAAAAGRTGTIKTLYALRDPSTSALKWLTWAGEIDIATPAADELNEQRFYYTGDGAPKVSTYALATAGLAPYPATGGYYELGLPLPTATPTATPTSFTTVNLSHSSMCEFSMNIILGKDMKYFLNKKPFEVKGYKFYRFIGILRIETETSNIL